MFYNIQNIKTIFQSRKGYASYPPPPHFLKTNILFLAFYSMLGFNLHSKETLTNPNDRNYNLHSKDTRKLK